MSPQPFVSDITKDTSWLLMFEGIKFSTTDGKTELP